MRTTSINMAIFGLLIFAGSLVAAPYSVDASHSSVGFSVRHMLSKTKGNFKVFEGTFDFDKNSKVVKDITFKIKTASIDTNNQKRDDHLRGSDFFESETYPEITFVAEKIKKSKDSKYELTGPLTLHGVTKTVTFLGEYLGNVTNPWGQDVASFSASAEINRKDFGLIWNKTLDNGGVLIGETVQISIEIEATPK